MEHIPLYIFLALGFLFCSGFLWILGWQAKKLQKLIKEKRGYVKAAEESLRGLQASYTEKFEELQKVLEEKQTQSRQLQEIQKEKERLLAEKEEAALEAVRLQERNKAAIEKTQEEVKAEYAKLKLEMSKTHEKELQDMRIEHDKWIQEHISEFAVYTEQLDKLQKSIAITEQKKRDEAMKEDFIATHTLAITERDYEDITTLTECRDKLNRKSVLDNLVWSEFVQAPLQQLRKDLVSLKLTDKVCGIYRITNTQNDRCYIGQAVDISKRWTEHIKAALNSPTDKFHKALGQVPLYSWTWEILEKTDKSQLNEREKFWIAHYKSNEFGYNTTSGNK